MVEQESRKQTVKRSMLQLAYMCDLRAQIKNGNFPLTHYSSGEVISTRMVKDKKGEWETRETYAELPIWPNPNDIREPGLLHAVDHAIFSRWLDLREVGKEEEANEIILYDGYIPIDE